MLDANILILGVLGIRVRPIIEEHAETVSFFALEADGALCAERLTKSIFTQGDTWDGLRANVRGPSRHSISTAQCQPAFACIRSAMKCLPSDETTT